jgi:hypothetical protein
MKRITIVVFGLFLWAGVAAQSYNTAFGLRMGTDWGFTAKQRIFKHTTLELIGQSSLQREELNLTLLAEQHFKLLFRRFNVYLGGGVHKGWVNQSAFDDGQTVAVPYDDPWGVTMIAGAELTIGRLNVSYDFKPAFNVEGGDRRFYYQTGISIRYVIFKRRWKLFKKKINWRFWEK